MSPAEFARRVLNLNPYPWQLEAMEAVGMGWHVALAAANGSGKTANVVAPLILWFLDQHPRGQVIFTSGSFRQIEKQLWPAVRRFQKHFPRWEFMAAELRTPQGGFAIGFSTDDPGRAEGWHPKTDAATDPVFIIVDEAKTVPNAIFEAFDRCTRRYQLWVSSPGAPRGQFFDAFHRDLKLHWTRRVPSTECPHISAEKRARDLDRYGKDHPVYRSMHGAEFTEEIGRLVLTSERLRLALETPPEIAAGETVAFCDFAAGGDENVLAIRRGNHAVIARAWTEKDTMQAAREFVHLFRVHSLQPGEIWGDADGLGTVMIDAIAELGFHLHRFHGGQAAREHIEYANLIAEVWHSGAREIERGRIRLGEIDPRGGTTTISPLTFEQLSTRKSEWTENGKLRVESKEKMSREGLPSPDRADALLGSIICGARLTGAITKQTVAAAYVPESDFAVGVVEF